MTLGKRDAAILAPLPNSGMRQGKDSKEHLVTVHEDAPYLIQAGLCDMLKIGISGIGAVGKQSRIGWLTPIATSLADEIGDGRQYIAPIVERKN